MKVTLINKAKKARKQAYVPYSKFKVGAALLLKNGKIICGANVENASYGLTICAERVAIGTAVAKGFTDFVAMAVVVDLPKPGAPCGACRQVIAEFAPGLPIILANKENEQVVTDLSQLLPYQFSKVDLAEHDKKTKIIKY
ncbi:MAG: cytidine deaminase [bacterium]|nr:cytidine deaminase [bacterium]